MVDVLVNQSKWNSLSASEREQIAQIMRTTGLMGKDDNVVGAAAPSTTPANTFQDANPVCILGCNAAEAAAVAACAAIPAPGNLVCVAVAHAAAAFCRSRC